MIMEAFILQLPFTEEEYDVFYNALVKAEKVKPKDFEKKVFEACMPIEELAARGRKLYFLAP